MFLVKTSREIDVKGIQYINKNRCRIKIGGRILLWCHRGLWGSHSSSERDGKYLGTGTSSPPGLAPPSG